MLNKCILIGNLTKDPELNTTPNGIEVCKFTLAVSRKFNKEETDFLPIVAWRKTAELCGQYLYKGSKVAICGSIQTRSYEAQDGGKRYITEIVADEVQFLDSKREEEQPKQQVNTSKMTPVAEDIQLPF